MTDFNNKYIKHCQLETIKKKINELDSLLSEYMQGATEEEKQAIPLVSWGKEKGILSLITKNNLSWVDFVSREDFTEVFKVQEKYIDDVIEDLNEEITYNNGNNDTIIEICEKYTKE